MEFFKRVCSHRAASVGRGISSKAHISSLLSAEVCIIASENIFMCKLTCGILAKKTAWLSHSAQNKGKMKKHLGDQLSCSYNRQHSSDCSLCVTTDCRQTKRKKKLTIIRGLLLKGLTSNSIPNQLGSEYIQSKASLQCCVCYQVSCSAFRRWRSSSSDLIKRSTKLCLFESCSMPNVPSSDQN